MSNSETTQPAARIPLQMDVEFRRSYSRSDTKGKLKNISITGAFLELKEVEEIMPKDKLLITIYVSGRERQIPAYVVWNSNMGCGVKFLPNNNRDVQIIDDLMYFVENTRSSQREVLDSIFKKVS
ncbi:MAG: PilZ domain-containing protein [Bdellovibrionales bacterium]|nr:PilZ domain-containing protein [Bdellovibrionales bacterium]